MPLLHSGVFVATHVRPASACRRVDAAHPVAAGMVTARFSAADRNRLLLERGIGPTTVARLERAGFHSIEALRQAGVQHVVDTIVESVSAPGWKNRLRALDRVIHGA